MMLLISCVFTFSVMNLPGIPYEDAEPSCGMSFLIFGEAVRKLSMTPQNPMDLRHFGVPTWSQPRRSGGPADRTIQRPS